MNDRYKVITVRDIVNEVLLDKKTFPNGMDTVVVSGDFEGNYAHQKHEIGYDGDKMFIFYEMHEGQN